VGEGGEGKGIEHGAVEDREFGLPVDKVTTVCFGVWLTTMRLPFEAGNEAIPSNGSDDSAVLSRLIRGEDSSYPPRSSTGQNANTCKKQFETPLVTASHRIGPLQGQRLEECYQQDDGARTRTYLAVQRHSTTPHLAA